MTKNTRIEGKDADWVIVPAGHVMELIGLVRYYQGQVNHMKTVGDSADATLEKIKASCDRDFGDG
ncbi:hypothetical protein [Marinomonas transparens]|uniref:Uncharacterized protein n=1 Tax=Marinomonas transparens TaxID=2795388 RepID=A0A934MVF4_9GAMM|nr:hypothetical protein [Marinomonas transparens]MBJ7536964.1 hypothetical protein [Marinomonas transparens]